MCKDSSPIKNLAHKAESVILFISDIMLRLATPAVDANLPPEVKLKAGAAIPTLCTGCSQAKLMSKTRLLLALLQVKEGRVGLHKAMLRHSTDLPDFYTL